MSDLLLYDAAGTPSPRRVKMCLIEKRLSFRIRWLNLALMDQKRPQYLKLNPMGLVPTLIDNGHVIFDSNAINEYLDAKFPFPPLRPEDFHAQAEMRMWFAFEADFSKPMRDAAYETIGKDRLKKTGFAPEQLQAEIFKRTANKAYARFANKVLTSPIDRELLDDRHLLLLEKMEAMEDRLRDGRTWLCGERFTLADIALGPRLDMFSAIGIPDLYSRFPMIGEFMKRLKRRPSWTQSDIRPEPTEQERIVTVDDGSGNS
jgi:glutathione S-transferase